MTSADNTLSGIRQVAIVGTGLLGGSLGLALRASGYRGRLLGVGRSTATVDRAVALGCVDAATRDLAEAARTSDLMVLATPVGTILSLLDTLGPHTRAGLTITDVGSTKGEICRKASAALRDAGGFVGSHPMAGNEFTGPDAARADLFRGKPCIVTPDKTSNADSLRVVEALWNAVGMRVIRLDAEAHDRGVALVSHLPHAVAGLLVEQALDGGALTLASTGFRDTTRVASGDPEMWRDIFVTNRAAVTRSIDDLIRRLASFRDSLGDAPPQKTLTERLARAKATRDEWIKKQSCGDTGRAEE